jgi:hypothetical protein
MAKKVVIEHVEISLYQVIKEGIETRHVNITEACISAVLRWLQIGIISGSTSLKERDAGNVLDLILESLSIASKIQRPSIHKKILSVYIFF